MKRYLLLIIVTAIMIGCIKPDRFDYGDNSEALTTIEATAAQLVYSQDNAQIVQTQWHTEDAIDIYYTAMQKWSCFKRPADAMADAAIAPMIGEQAWKNSVRTHILYALHPSQGFDLNSEVDPSAVPLTVPSVQLYSQGAQSYMVSTAAAKVQPGKDVSIVMEPSLAMLEIELKAKGDFSLKTIKLELAGAQGQAITGSYNLDITDNSINSREAHGRDVTIDFGDGLEMTTENIYRAGVVILPSKLDGAQFILSGSTTGSSVELFAISTVEYKGGLIYKVSADIFPGPIAREYSFEATSDIYGTSVTNTALSFQGLYCTSSTNKKGITISSSKVDEQFEDGSSQSKDLYWEATAPDWVTLSQTNGSGSANIDLFITPNVKPLTSSASGSTIDLSASETANCYIVSAPGSYKFKVSVMGNGDQGVLPSANFQNYSGSIINSATLSSATSAKVLWQDMARMFTKVELQGDYIEFTTPSTIYPGNAVIALYNGNTIIWSWHLWFSNGVTSDKITNANTNSEAVAAGENIFYLMDRNLGALGMPEDVAGLTDARNGNITITQYTDNTKSMPTGKSFTVPVYQVGIKKADAYKMLYVGGMKYQWGRKDPFMMPYTTGVNSSMGWIDANENFTTASTSFADNTTAAVTIANTITSPNILYSKNNSIIAPANNYLWGNIIKASFAAADFSHNTSLRGQKTIYDPCPPGYMVAPIDAFTYLVYSNRVGNFGAAEYAGYRLKASPDDNNGIFFPATGYISTSGTTLNVGTFGGYFSNSVSTSSATTAYSLRYTDATSANFKNPDTPNRNSGLNVRCVKNGN